MNRRDIIKSMGLITLHSLYPAVARSYFIKDTNIYTADYTWTFFEEDEQKILTTIIDIIIPKTSTPSASEAMTHLFLDQIFGNCLNSNQKELIKSGFAKVKSDWHNTENKENYVKMLDNRAYMRDENFAWFKIVKQYTMIGFFTSEAGTKKAGNYIKTPDRFVGEITIKPDTLLNSKTFLKFYF